MLSNLTLKKSKQTEKLKVITFFSVAHFGLLLPKTRLILAPVWPFLKNFWFRFRLLKDNSMMMINSTDFASNLQKNRKMWTISYLLRWINNYRVLLLVYLENSTVWDHQWNSSAKTGWCTSSLAWGRLSGVNCRHLAVKSWRPGHKWVGITGGSWLHAIWKESSNRKKHLVVEA